MDNNQNLEALIYYIETKDTDGVWAARYLRKTPMLTHAYGNRTE